MNEQYVLFNHLESSEGTNKYENYKGKPRLVKPVRNQIEMMTFSIDQLIPSDHKARMEWLVSVSFFPSL